MRVLVGMESDGNADGSGTTMYMYDPWPGTPGKIKLSYADFLTLYEGRVGNSGGQLEYQILHADRIPAGLVPVTAAPFSLTLADEAQAALDTPKNEVLRLPEVAALLRSTPGIDLVLDRRGQRELGLDHDRAGELVAISSRDRWFSYYFWLDDRLAPDFARTVDIHRKPGYDPAELFVDPALALPQLTVAAILARKALGFRYLMKVIPLDASLVRGSHGRVTESLDDGPVMISSMGDGIRVGVVESTAVRDVILDHLFANV